MSNAPNNPYSSMQRRFMDSAARTWQSESLTAEGSSELSPIEFGVGNFRDHNEWPDYETYLFEGLETQGKVMLDFACGPGRNIVRFWDRFERIDGVDICSVMLENARSWIAHNGIGEAVRLIQNNGSDLQGIDDSQYDFVMSTIALQHVAVHSIRYQLLGEFFRVLRPGGWITIQMAFGADHPNSTGYFENAWTATGTNRQLDVRIEDPDEVRSDLEALGFESFQAWVRPAVPGSDARRGGRSIFFRARQPAE